MPVGLLPLMLVIAGNDGSPWASLPFLAAAVGYAVALLRPTDDVGEVTVGADGVVVARPGKVRFISFADVTDLRVTFST